jgi:hypothetical protein
MTALCTGPRTTGSAPPNSLSRRWSYGSSGLLVATTAVAEEKDFLQVFFFPVRPLDLVDGRRSQLLLGDFEQRNMGCMKLFKFQLLWPFRISCRLSNFGDFRPEKQLFSLHTQTKIIFLGRVICQLYNEHTN